MATTDPNHGLDAAGGSGGDDQQADAQTHLEQTADGRVSVQRVLEYVRGERDAGEVRKGDWFQALESVHTETGADLVIYSEHEHDEGHDVATIWAVDETTRQIIHCGWTECRVPSLTPGYTGPERITRRDVEDRFRFDGGRPREVLTLETAKDRLRAFAETRGDDR